MAENKHTCPDGSSSDNKTYTVYTSVERMEALLDPLNVCNNCSSSTTNGTFTVNVNTSSTTEYTGIKMYKLISRPYFVNVKRERTYVGVRRNETSQRVKFPKGVTALACQSINTFTNEKVIIVFTTTLLVEFNDEGKDTSNILSNIFEIKYKLESDRVKYVVATFNDRNKDVCKIIL